MLEASPIVRAIAISKLAIALEQVLQLTFCSQSFKFDAVGRRTILEENMKNKQRQTKSC